MQWKHAMKMAASCLAILALILSFAVPANAQSAGTGQISGTVKDTSGAVIPGAEVTVKNLATGSERKFSTTDVGYYTAPFLVPGTYEVRVKKEGFAEVIRPSLAVAVGQTLTIDVEMPVRAAQETVTVTSEVGLVETEKTEVSQVVNQDQVENLPLNGRRWDNLALLTPGAGEDGGFGLISFRGVSALYNNNMVDGADNNQAFFSEARGRTRIGYGYSINSIKEFQVQTAAFSAEYGRAAGGVVNAVTKSGGNEWHGDFFYFIRDKAFLARDAAGNAIAVFDPATGTTAAGFKPDERRQQFGGSFSGPLVKDKLFFFLNYDEQRRNFPLIHGPSNLDFMNFAASGSPARICDEPAAATQTLPAIDNTMAQCQAVLDSLLPITSVVAPRKGDQRLGLAKADYQWNANNRINGVFNILRWNSPNGIQTASTLTGTSPLANGTDKVDNEFITVTWNSVLTSSIVNEAKFQYGRDFEAQLPNASGPQIQLAGITFFGMPNFLPRGRFPDEKRFQWVDNVSWLKGRHQMKFGVDINHIRDNIQNLFNGDGQYSYSGNDALRRFVFDLNNAGQRTYNFFQQAADPITGSGEGFFTTNDYNVYFQDNIKLRPNLTVNLGVRYEVQVMPTPPQPNPLVPESATLNTDSNNIAPRIGFSWAMTPKQVLRGGYGIYFGRTQNSTIFVHMFQNGIFQRTVNLTPAQAAGCAGLAGLTVPNLIFPLPSTAPPVAPIFGSTGPTPTTIFSSFNDFATACPTVTAAGSALQTLSPDFANPLVHQYDIAYEMELPWKMGITANYVGSRGNRLPIFYDNNLPAPSATRSYAVLDASGNPFPIEGTSNRFTVPFFIVNAANPRPRASAGVTGPLVIGQSIVNSWYNAMVIRVRRRESKGFSFDANYTLARSRDNGMVLGTFGTFFGTNSPINPFDLRGEYGNSDTDIRQRFIVNAYWVAPFADWTDNEGLKKVVGGWKFAGVAKIQDGRPITAQMAGRPSCSGSASGTNAGGLTCGTASNSGGAINGRVPFLERNKDFTAPGLVTFDLRVARVFKITESSDIEFLWEAFNLFNRANVTGVQTSLYDFINAGSTSSGIACPNAATLAAQGVPDHNGCLVRRFSPRVTPSSSFGATSSTDNTLYKARQMQLGLKFRF